MKATIFSLTVLVAVSAAVRADWPEAEFPPSSPKQSASPNAPGPFPTDALPLGQASQGPVVVDGPPSGQEGRASGHAIPNLTTAGDMIGFSRDLGGGSQAITLIQASRRWMAVYHIDTSGQIRLVSSRPLDADFTIQFNVTAPLPEEIRRLQGG